MIHFEEAHLVFITREIPARIFTVKYWFIITHLDVEAINKWCTTNIEDYVVGLGSDLLWQYGIRINYRGPSPMWRSPFTPPPEWYVGFSKDDDALRFKMTHGIL